MKPTISLCMITKDEERNLENFLIKIKDFVDEIIIVDTGSTDNTKEIAKKFNVEIYDFKWNDDFSSARNFSIAKASKDWILVLDPDEIINKDDLIKLKGIISLNKKSPTKVGVFFKPQTRVVQTAKAGVLNPSLSNKKDIVGYRLIQKTIYNGETISVRGICRIFKNTKKSAKQISGARRNSKGISCVPEKPKVFLRMPEIQRISEHNDKIRFTYPIHETVRESIKKLNGGIGRTGIVIEHYPKMGKEKQDYYLGLLKIKKEKFPSSNVDKEIENEYELFSPS